MDLYQSISASPKTQILSIALAPIANTPVIQAPVPASLPPQPAPTITAPKTTSKIFVSPKPLGNPPTPSTINTPVSGYSFLPTNTHNTLRNAIFLPVNASTTTGGSFFPILTTSTIKCSEISTGILSLDQAILTANATELLLNGIPLATTSNISSLADWAIDPAISTVNLNNNSIINGNQIYANDFLGNLLNINQAFISDLTVYQQTTENFASTITIDARTINCSTLNVNDNLFSEFATVSTLVVSSININGSNINPNNNDWSVFPAVSKVNMAGFDLYSGNGSNLTVNADRNLTLATNSSNIAIVAGQSNLTALGNFTTLADTTTFTSDGGVNTASETDFIINSSNGNRGRFTVNANAGFNNGVGGEIRLNATGGVAPLCNVGSGGLIELNATSQGVGLTSAIKFNASGINSYAGAIPSIGSLAGYNFIYGTTGVNLCAGLPSVFPNIPGTTYIYGVNGVSIDGLNTCQIKNTAGFEVPNYSYLYAIQPFYNGLTTPPDLLIKGRTVNLFDDVCVNLSNVRNLDFQSNVATRITNVDSITMSNGSITGVSNINLTNINGSAYPPNIGPVLNTVNTINMIGGAINGLDTVNGLPYGTTGSNVLVSTLNTASISSATISSINNFASFFSKSMRIEGDVAQIQLSNNNPGGAGTILNLLSRVGNSEIQSYNSNFTTPLPLYLNASFVSTQSFQSPDITTSTLKTVQRITGKKTTDDGAGNIFTRFDYNPPTGTGYGGIQISGKAQNAGAIATLELGSDLTTGSAYVGSFWDGFISMPLQLYGANIRFDSDAETLMYMNGNAGGAGYVSTGVAFSAPNISTPTIDAPALTSVSSINGVIYPEEPIFGEFYTTTSVAVAGANTPTVIPLDTFPVGNGVNLDAGDVEFLTTGLYQYSFNVQLDKSGGGADICDIWLRLNGADIADTGSRVSVQGNTGQCLAVCSFLLNVNALDKVAIVFASADATMTATFFPAWSTLSLDPYDRPAVPANIVQVKKIR